MLSSNLIGNYKFVLFVDNFGIDPNWKTILTNLLEEQNQNYKFYNEFENILEKSCIILGSLSELELKYSSHIYENIFRKIQELKSSENVLQIFGWISSKNVQNKILLSFLEHMSNLTVTINNSQHMTIVSKNKSGIIRSREYVHELSLGKTSIKEYKKENIQLIAPEVNVENMGTFKIGQKADELEAKRSLKLPFEIIDLPNKTANVKQEGKIIYTPDITDDFDEEDDPDNDLQF
ncbi:elongator complex protein 5 [Chironomus tepperi]|uniref:elongator complex protein 5 n=1 Tax=Chironomus tepperi TaxID=113505 RepID=UPI00391F18D5